MKSLTDLIWTKEDETNTAIIIKPAGLIPPLKGLCIAVFCLNTASTEYACKKDAPMRTLACI